MYDTFIQRRLEGTCNWILERPEFRHWEATNSDCTKVLWIHGPAGYGKTILCARLVEHLLAHYPLAYYFFSSDSDSRTDPFIIIRSWISQVISQNRHAFELARGQWEATDGRPATQIEIAELFTLIVRNTPNCIFLVDGLDECAGTGHDWKPDYQDSLLAFFTSLKHATSNTKSRLIVVSRNEPDIRSGLRIEVSGAKWDLIECRITSDDVKPDATLFSRSMVDRKLKTKNETEREDLAHRLVDRFESMFLCIKMLEGQLRDGKGRAPLQRAIQRAPTALGDLYDRNWRRIHELPEPDRSRALAIIRWATFALRPMTILEITDALLLADKECGDLWEELPDALDKEYVETEILNLCGSLIETRGTSSDPASWTIHLTHFTIRQYILCHSLAAGGHLITNEQLRLSNEMSESNILAITCLRYLGYDEVWGTEPASKTHTIQAFRQYATDSWFQHIKLGAPNITEVIGYINAFFHPSCKNWEAWRKLSDVALQDEMLHYQESIHSGSRLFYASLLGLLETIAFLIENAGLEINHVDSSSRTALLAASSKGWSLGVMRLLEKGADPNIASNERRTPTYVAARNGHAKVVKLLLEKGADLAIANKDGWTPLNSASNKGHLEVVKLLLENGADLTVANNNGIMPLISACKKGHTDTVRLLLECNNMDLASGDNRGRTAFSWAAHGGHKAVIEPLFVDKRINRNWRDNNGLTPLMWAARKCHESAVKLLVQHGCLVFDLDYDFFTFQTAFFMSHDGFDKIMISLGFKNTNDCFGLTSLYN